MTISNVFLFFYEIDFQSSNYWDSLFITTTILEYNHQLDLKNLLILKDSNQIVQGHIWITLRHWNMLHNTMHIHMQWIYWEDSNSVTQKPEHAVRRTCKWAIRTIQLWENYIMGLSHKTVYRWIIKAYEYRHALKNFFALPFRPHKYITQHK